MINLLFFILAVICSQGASELKVEARCALRVGREDAPKWIVSALILYVLATMLFYAGYAFPFN